MMTSLKVFITFAAIFLASCNRRDSKTTSPPATAVESEAIDPVYSSEFPGIDLAALPRMDGFAYGDDGLDHCIGSHSCEARFHSPFDCQNATIVFRSFEQKILSLQIKRGEILLKGLYYIFRFRDDPLLVFSTNGQRIFETHDIRCED